MTGLVYQGLICSQLVRGTASHFLWKLKPEYVGRSLPVDDVLESHAVYGPCDPTITLVAVY